MPFKPNLCLFLRLWLLSRAERQPGSVFLLLVELGDPSKWSSKLGMEHSIHNGANQVERPGECKELHLRGKAGKSRGVWDWCTAGSELAGAAWVVSGHHLV